MRNKLINLELQLDHIESEEPALKENTEESKLQKVEDLTMIERFFHDHWVYWMNKAKLIMLAITVIWLGIAAWRTSLFEPSTETIGRLPKDHEIEVTQQSISYDYHDSQDTGSVTVDIIWGISGIDKSGVDRWDARDLGKNIYDDNLNLAPEANQQRILDICNDLKTHNLVKDQQVTCWIEDFLNAQNGGSPVAEANFYTELENYLNTITGSNQYNDNQIGYVNGRLYFFMITASTNLEPFTGYEEMWPVYEKWEALVQDYNENSPEGVNNAYQTARYQWAFLVTEKEMVNSAVQGIIISLAFAYIVLTLSTLNIVISSYAILCISCIVVSVIAIMQLAGWQLGIIEAIAIVIIIGFSVDYVVHLANHYVESVYKDKFRRMQDSLTGVGISIVSGAITTLGSSLPLFFALIVFFNKFAILMLSTILFSLYSAMVIFVSINLLIGPSGTCGDLSYYIVRPVYGQIKKLWTKDKGIETSADEEEIPQRPTTQNLQ